MARINIACKGCGKAHDVSRTEEIPDDVVSLTCNWCPDCEATEEYDEQYVYEPAKEPEDPAQLKLFIDPNNDIAHNEMAEEAKELPSHEVEQRAEIIRGSHSETIECPECKCIQQAEVKHTIPFRTYVHHCEKCGYVIMESEWNQVSWLKKQEMEFKDQLKRDSDRLNGI